MTIKIYHIPPDQTLMEDIGATSFTLAEAIVELVANCIDARPSDKDGNPKNLNIEVSVSPDEVVILDDASGMTEDILVEAARLGAKMDKFLGVRKRKGMYGLGLKTAAASIGRYWAVHTRTAGSTEDCFLEFDLEKYGSGSNWEIEIERRQRTSTSILGNRESGTAIIINKLRSKTNMPAAVTRMLGDAYTPHILAGDHIFVNGYEAPPRSYDFKTVVEFDEVIGDPKNNWHVHGWVGLDSQTHNDGEYGFNLFRENQLIETWDKSWFKAHLMTSRIIGEAHMDFMPVNFNKQGFKTQSEEWNLTTEHMINFLRPVVKSSRDASRGKGDETKLQRAIQGMVRAMNGLSSLDSNDNSNPIDGSKVNDKDVYGNADNNKLSITANSIILKGQEIIPTWIADDWDSEEVPWDYLDSPCGENKTEVQAVLNSASRLYKETTDTNILGLLALSECVTRYLVERCSIEPSEARVIRDKWIYAALSKSDNKKEES